MRYDAPYPTGNGLVDSDFQAMAGFRLALRRFFRFSEAIARSAGVSPRQYQALLAVRAWNGAEPMSIGELADHLQLQHHSTVGLVQRLVASGLLDRQTLARDRRRASLIITSRGHWLLQQLASAHRTELKSFRPQIEALLALL